MAKSIALGMFVVLLGAGCQLTTAPVPVTAPAVAPPAPPLEIPAELIGKECAVNINSRPQSTSVYYGTLATVDDENVVLANAYCEGRVERGVPVLEHIPFIGRMYKNTAIGRQTFDHDVTLSRKDIEQINIYAAR